MSDFLIGLWCGWIIENFRHSEIWAAFKRGWNKSSGNKETGE